MKCSKCGSQCPNGFNTCFSCYAEITASSRLKRTQIERLIDGLLMVLRYEPGAIFAVGKDEIWIGSDKSKEMSLPHRNIMKSSGFYYDDDLDCWHKFV